jgi:uncharacterized membrane protein YdjX (TVP38/TMEM64 family)
LGLPLPFFIKTSAPVSDNLHPLGKQRSNRIADAVSSGIFLAMTGLGLAIYLSPLRVWLADGQFIKDCLALLGIAAPLAFTLATAFLTAIGIPRLLLGSLGGMAFGFAWGLAWSQLGTLMGSYGIFLFIRWRGRRYAMHNFPCLRRFSQGVKSRGIMAVAILRQLPINGFYNTVLLGLTPVGHGDFLLGSFLGFLPLGISASLLGAGLMQRDLLQGVQYITLGLAASAMLGFIFNRLFNRTPATRDL